MSSPRLYLGPPGPCSGMGKVGRPTAIRGVVFSQGPSPFRPQLALEVGVDTSQIKVRGQRSAYLFACMA